MRQPNFRSARPRASVYVLQRLDRARFKIGWALDPLKRVRQLPEFNRRQIDLHRSSVLWLPSRHRAEQVERSMQKSLGPYRSPAEHHGDGHSEWFDGVAHPFALRLLGQIPVDVATGSTGKLIPLEPDFSSAVESAERGCAWIPCVSLCSTGRAIVSQPRGVRSRAACPADTLPHR